MSVHMVILERMSYLIITFSNINYSYNLNVEAWDIL